MSTDYAEVNKTKRQRVLELLSDLQWHTHVELQVVGGVRYGARLLELKRLGYAIEDQSLEPQGKRYRLASMVRGAPQEKRVKVFLSKEDAQMLLEDVVTTESHDAVRDALSSYLSNEHKL
jgi:hypothetical protein